MDWKELQKVAYNQFQDARNFPGERRRRRKGGFLLIEELIVREGIKAGLGEESTSREDLIVFCQKAARSV